MRKQRVISSPGANVTSVEFPKTGERVLIHCITGSFNAVAAIATGRVVALVKTWAGAEVDQVFFLSSAVSDGVDCIFQFSPGVQATSIGVSASSVFATAPLPEDDGLILETGDTLSLVIFGADVVDVIGALGMSYSVLAQPRIQRG